MLMMSISSEMCNPLRRQQSCTEPLGATSFNLKRDARPSATEYEAKNVKWVGHVSISSEMRDPLRLTKRKVPPTQRSVSISSEMRGPLRRTSRCHGWSSLRISISSEMRDPLRLTYQFLLRYQWINFNLKRDVRPPAT